MGFSGFWKQKRGWQDKARFRRLQWMTRGKKVLRVQMTVFTDMASIPPYRRIEVIS